MNLAEQVLKEILKEEANVAYVSDAIKKKYEVELNYQADDDKKGSGKRIIQPVALGHSTKGNLVLRAFQPYGDTKTKIPKWKLFRLDRIKSWNPTEQHFNAQPKERGWNAPAYNETGDNTMSQVLHQVTFDYDATSDNPYMKGI